ncbi:MAG: hypothetical protein QOH93_2093 [Chloroflexia bacterium]|jgi:cupin fold WbuC family metalloprotein|nr:hypothetical protein [Chloroflexia bacterium]
MSTPYRRNPHDPYALVPFSDELLDEVSRAAESSPRRRSIIRLHEHDDTVQRMFNAIRTNSYARPHRHSDPDKTEVFVALRGMLLVVRFSDDGAPIEGVLIREEGPVRGVEIPAGAWHSVVSLDNRTVLFEVMHGPYDANSHKNFAPWAPPEDDRKAGLAFIANLRAHFALTIPEVAALNALAEEDKDVF